MPSRRPVYHEERFRTPTPGERSVGLWVDRIGRKAGERNTPGGLRVLGQYAAVGIEQGNGWVETRKEAPRRVQNGDVILVHPNTPTRYYPEPGTAWTTAWIVWNGPDMKGLERLGIWDGTRLAMPQAQPLVSQTWAALAPLLAEESRAAILRRKIVLLDLLHGILPTEPHTGGDHPFLSQAIALMNTPGMEAASVAELAAQMGLSPTHFRRLFRAHTGAGPKVFQTSLRITRAKELLAGGRRIKEVARQLQFGDEFHFMRLFKRVAGQTAGAFQRAAMER